MKRYNNPKEALVVVAGMVEMKGKKLIKVVGDCSLRVSGALDYLNNYCGYNVVYPLQTQNKQ